MKYLFYILLLIVTACACDSDSPTRESFHFFSEENRINWKKVDAVLSENEKTAFAKSLKNQFPYLFNESYESGKYSLTDFIKHLHFIDLNADQKQDVIYEGYSGAESANSQFFIQKNGSFVRVASIFQYVEKLNFDAGGVLSSVVMLDFGCCADYVESETNYAVSNDFSFRIASQRMKTNYTVAPKSIFQQPLLISTINDGYCLRSAPIIDDTSTIIYDNVGKGNVVARYPKNSPGLAWAEKSDGHGRTWYLVEMNPVKTLTDNLIFYKDSIAPKQIGWMSKNFLKTR